MEDPECVGIATDLVSMVILRAKEEAEHKSSITGGVKVVKYNIKTTTAIIVLIKIVVWTIVRQIKNSQFGEHLVSFIF